MLVDFFVLGAVEARVRGNNLSLGGIKQRAILARLVMCKGQTLSPSQLCDELWENDPPRDPTHALQARISRLRSTLPIDIEFTSGGYRLDPAYTHCDAEQFEHLQQQATAHLAAGELAQAGDCLHAALTLWRGPAFADIPDMAGLRVETARLNHLWSAALADRIDVDLALGQAGSLVPELQSLVETYPSLERHWGQLMLALYATDRAQDSLEIFERARTVFTEATGAEPGESLRRLHLAILLDQPVEQLLHAHGINRVQGHTGSNGQSREVQAHLSTSRCEDLVTRLNAHRALLVTGPSGIGKSHVLREVRDRLTDTHNIVLLLTGNTLGQNIPLGVFTGAASQLEHDLNSPAALIDYFARHRSHSTILIDNVHLLDESSLFVVTQLIRTTRVAIVLCAPDLTNTPTDLQSMYDGGELTEVQLTHLTDAEAHDLAARIIDGKLTPDTRARIVSAAAGNPLHLREIIEGSRASERLVHTDHGWELRGEPAPSPRLAELVGERFSELDAATTEAAIRLAIAGELPVEAMEEAPRRALARTSLIEIAENGWLRLALPMDREILHHRTSDMLWRDLTREVVGILRSPISAANPQARLRADVLALDLNDPIDIPATFTLAERALAAFDERLALRAAEAIIAQDPTHSQAHRIIGLAASALGRPERSDAHFARALMHATNDTDRSAIAIAHAHHRGLRLHDAVGAQQIIADAQVQIVDSGAQARLRHAHMRWAAVAGMASGQVPPAALTEDVADAFSLITVGVSGVITGPLTDAARALTQLRRIPNEITDRVPGGAALIELTDVMALSYSGDIVATQQRIEQHIAAAESAAPETVGMWEYAYGFSELFSGDAERAYAVATSAVSHLHWRDTTGLTSAAHALAAAAACVTGRTAVSEREFAAIPESAAGDPKVVMLQAWTAAWQARAAGRVVDAARTLVDAAEWLLTAQHTFFAGMLAHCAMRTGHLGEQAAALIASTAASAGGGLLELFSRHAEAHLTSDVFGLDVVARHARELGLVATASDTLQTLLSLTDDEGLRVAREQSVNELSQQYPSFVTWAS